MSAKIQKWWKLPETACAESGDVSMNIDIPQNQSEWTDVIMKM